MRLYFADEAAWSLTTEMGYVWFFPGERPKLKASVTRSYWYVIGAADPQTGDFFAILMPWLNTEAFQAFLDALAEHLKPVTAGGEEVWLALDQAGWHVAKDLRAPEGIRLLPMPTAAAQINPAERIWKYMREEYTQCRVFEDLDELEEILCQATLELGESPEIIHSLCAKPETRKT